MLEFSGAKVLVVGGSSGIGEAVAGILTAKGAQVYNASRRPSKIEGVKNLGLDITSNFETIEGTPEVLDGLIYAPGTINLRPFQSLKIDDFQQDFEVNVLGAVKVMKACWKNLKRSDQSPGVVFFSTVAVSMGMNFHSSVATSKGALEGLAKALAAEYAKYNIRINTIAPSLTDTPLAANLLASEERREAGAARHPLKSIGNPHDLASTAVFLLSQEAKWITGQVVRQDGGLSTIKSF